MARGRSVPLGHAFAAKRKPAATPEALAGAPEGVDEAHLAPLAGTLVDGGAPPATAPRSDRAKAKPPPTWTLASTNEGALDLQALLHAAEPDVVAYAAGTLHVARPLGRFYLLVGADAPASGCPSTAARRPPATRRARRGTTTT